MWGNFLHVHRKAPKKARGGLQKAKAYLEKNEIESFYDALFKTLQDYLSGKLNMAKGNIAPEEIERRLSSVEPEEEVLKMFKEVFSACEMAR